QAGWIDVVMEDGTAQRIHRAEHFKCEDGKLRTVEEALDAGVKLPMAVVSVTGSHPGLSETKASEIWQAFEKNGAYQFNKSHSVA
ncbi:hypothetical protein NL447_26860, partial [Klebsiella pneumoniae]|nr:hypothetical protein [Klebsiella pneumoniae]